MTRNEQVRVAVITKEQAAYVSPSPVTQQCGNCAMFKSGSCDLVLGPIETYAVCREWITEPEV